MAGLAGNQTKCRGDIKSFRVDIKLIRPGMTVAFLRHGWLADERRRERISELIGFTGTFRGQINLSLFKVWSNLLVKKCCHDHCVSFMILPFSFPDASAPLLSCKYFWPPFAKDWIISRLKDRAKTPYCMYLCVPCRFSGKLANSWLYTVHHLLGSHYSPDFKK